jgi:hypothetical protein
MQLVFGRDSAIIDKHFVNYLLDLMILLHAVWKSAIDPNNHRSKARILLNWQLQTHEFNLPTNYDFEQEHGICKKNKNKNPNIILFITWKNRKHEKGNQSLA